MTLENCQRHREMLIRVARIGLGYVLSASERVRDRTERATCLRHAAEIEVALSATVPPADDVLKRLGRSVSQLRAALEAYPGRAGATETEHNNWLDKRDAALRTA